MDFWRQIGSQPGNLNVCLHLNVYQFAFQLFAILFEHLPAYPSVFIPVCMSASLSKCLPSRLNVCQPVQEFAILSVCVSALSDDPLPACLNITPKCERLLPRMNACQDLWTSSKMSYYFETVCLFISIEVRAIVGISENTTVAPGLSSSIHLSVEQPFRMLSFRTSAVFSEYPFQCWEKPSVVDPDPGQTRMFLGFFPDPDQSFFVRIRIRIQILPSSSKKVRNTWISTIFDLFDFLSLKDEGYPQKVESKETYFFVGIFSATDKKAGTGSVR
jgi:hypothetical protein